MKQKMPKRAEIVVLACSDDRENDYIVLPLSQDGGADKPIQLLPYGWVNSKKGKFLVDEESIKLIMAAAAREENDIVIDYEHQTLTGAVAPASGWIKEFIDRGKDGLWGRIDWTPKAKEYIANKEYRYFSPVVFVRKSDRRAIYLHSGGLTNTPAIDGMEPIANKTGTDPNKEDITNMEFLRKLAALLGLADTATEEEVTQAVQGMMNKLQTAAGVVANKAVLTLLGLPDTAKEEEVRGAIIALKNPAGYVKAEDFKALQNRLALRDRDELVTMALKAGKVTPAQKGWAEEYALKDPAGFQAFVDQAPVVVPLSEIAGGTELAHKQVLEGTQLSVNKALGISDDDFKKYGGAE